MPVTSLSVEYFRNLENGTLTFSPQLNIFTGENAAGKTSVLESLYVLARARSFRTHHLGKVVRREQPGFNLVARVQHTAGTAMPVGLAWRSGNLTAKINGESVKRLSELAKLFPLQWLGGNLHRLIEEGPVHRRQYLDWGLFHVKPAYIKTWKRYQKLLKQRNAALRVARNPAEISVWDSELVTAGMQLDEIRKAYSTRLSELMPDLMEELSATAEKPVIRYRQGWKSRLSLSEALAEGLSRDRELGYTRSGPHRANLMFEIGDRPVAEQYSRGQQKLLVIALQIAQACLLKEQLGRPSVFLLDDLGAELDQANQRRVIRLLYALEAQVFVTSIQDVDVSSWEYDQVNRFHVKHGRITNVV